MLKRIAELETEVKDLKAPKTEEAAANSAITKAVQPQELSPGRALT